MSQYFTIQNFVFLLTSVVLLIIAINIFLAFYFLKFKKRFSALFKGKKVENLESIILNHLQKIKKHDVDIVRLVEQVKKLQDVSEKTFQKSAIVRFNPFNNIGGNQSFVIALLDNQDNGFIISSLFIKDGNRVYAKAIKNGQSDNPLSKEEKEAITRAMSLGNSNF
ncbi:DUF4446 family protein [Patescibacteria group bacterium]|nr:DUF4446 family protein [Patescibacteria group bacterium]